ncbi:MAG: YfiR family protein [Sulfuritalea sp.]|nr:YfiR family protein [Sulfuritalea sp.]
MWRRLCRTILPALLLALPCHAAWAAERADENEVKAAVIYNLLLFVQWPPQAAPASGFRFCVLDEGALTMALRRHAGKKVQGQTLDIQRIAATPEELDRCAAVMVEAGNAGLLARLGALARTRALLVIADGANAIDRGAMIGLHTDGGRVTFDINYGAMKKSGLAPSSKILKLARTLIE